jgi:cytochrome c oxidase cbb3-type subunit 3
LLSLLLLVVGLGVATACYADKGNDQPTPLLVVTTTKSMQRALVDLKDTIANNNYVFIRQQNIDSRLTDVARENGRVILVYFCNFNMLDRALKKDSRVGVFLPCRITLIQKADHIEMVAINPKVIGKRLNEKKLNELCDQLSHDYSQILEEATL